MTDVLYDFGTGGYDVYFTMPALSVGQYVIVRSNSAFVADDKNIVGKYGGIRITRTSGGFTIGLYDRSTRLIEAMPTDLMISDNCNRMRLTVHNNFISVYANRKWINTFWLKAVQHEEEPEVGMYGTNGLVITDILYPQLNDWRDAIFIDLEQTGINAINSVILSKPIETWSTWDGKVCFAVDPSSGSIGIDMVHRVQHMTERSAQASSDGIVYYTDVAVVINEAHLAEYGFSTKLIRIPDVDYGVKAGTKIQERARKQQEHSSVTMRFSPYIEYNDTAKGTFVNEPLGETIVVSLRIKSLRVSLSESTANMEISGYDV